MNSPTDLSFFLCQYEDLTQRLQNINPVEYNKTRNYLDGSVTWLSPFITHGIINTVDVATTVLRSYTTTDCDRLLFELAWREYFHRVWESNGNAIFSDMKHPSPSHNTEIPEAILNATTGINVIDAALNDLNNHGFMHNHARMWVAAMCCNMGNTHWRYAAKWLHYHLLDGDLASNTLSWQWVAGTFSNKRYIANQDNINKYSKSLQQRTFLDTSYEALAEFRTPQALIQTANPDLPQTLPGKPATELNELRGTVAVRSVWQLDPQWRTDADHQILFIENAQQIDWPMSPNRWEFILHWATIIPNLHIINGTIEQLNAKLKHATVMRQQYPACDHWGEATDTRHWLYPAPRKNYNSFFKFWKLVKDHSQL